MTSSKQVNNRKNLRQSITNIPCDDSGQTTDLGVLSAYLYTPESCDGLQRNDHVMLLQGVVITVQTPICLNVFRSIIRIGSTLSQYYSSRCGITIRRDYRCNILQYCIPVYSSVLFDVWHNL